jgi:hypothetical protein
MRRNLRAPRAVAIAVPASRPSDAGRLLPLLVLAALFALALLHAAR